MRTAVDTNVLVCLLNGEPGAAQVAQALFTAQAQGRLFISGLVYAESRHPSYLNYQRQARAVRRRPLALSSSTFCCSPAKYSPPERG